MTSKSMAYDHPAYTVPYVPTGLTVAGANGVTNKFAAFTDMKVKQIVHTPFVASTAAGSQPLLYKKSGTATSTTTLTVLTSGAVAAIVDDITDVTLAQGDLCWYTHGTDATCAVGVAFECIVTPGANVTV